MAANTKTGSTNNEKPFEKMTREEKIARAAALNDAAKAEIELHYMRSQNDFRLLIHVIHDDTYWLYPTVELARVELARAKSISRDQWKAYQGLAAPDHIYRFYWQVACP